MVLGKVVRGTFLRLSHEEEADDGKMDKQEWVV